MSDQTLDILHPLTSLEWKEWPSLPVEMRDACSVYLNGTLYVGGGFISNNMRAEASLYSFKPGVDSTWTVTHTPTFFYTLVAHDFELLLVGGKEYYTREFTNNIFTMRDGQFVETLPPMKETRHLPAAVSSGSALVVAGGKNTSGELSSVEVFKDGQWTTAPSLPREGCDMKSALHGDQWYLITGQGQVFCASLQSLISGADKSPWETLPDAPNHFSAAAFCGDRLLSIGGGSSCDAIHAFSPSTQSWEHVDDLPVPVSLPTVVALSSDELLVFNLNKIIHGKFMVTPFDADSNFKLETIDYLEISAGICLIDELVQHTPTAFLPTAGVDVRAMYDFILEKWELGLGSRQPTWTELFRALKEMGLSELAGRMEKYLRGSFPEDPPRPPPDEEGDSEEEKDDETPEQEILRLNHVLAECISTNTLLKNTIHNLEQQIAQFANEKQHIKQETEAEPQATDDLRGVEVVASTCVIVTNSPQTFHWVGYGFKLTILQGSLPAGVDQCRLDIKASVSGQYQFPDNLQLVSSVFWVRLHPSCRFQQQLTVEIQHCAKMTSSTKLSFVRAHCSQESLPYTFKQLEGRGSFTKHSSYGCLSVNHFSSFAIAAEGDVDLLYVASLYYLKADPRTVEIHFTINVDDGAHIAETRKHFDKLGAKEKLNLELEFDDSNISLDIPLPSGVNIDEWSLVPLVLPMISKKRIDSFKPGRTVPSTKLEATLAESSWDCKVPRRSHLITLKGAKEPKNQMLIVLDPVDPNQGVAPQAINFRSAVVSNPSGSLAVAASITVADIVRHVGICEVDLDRECSNEHLQEIGTFLPNWPKFAEALLLTPAQITGIQVNPNICYEMKAEKVLELWHDRESFRATYRRLVEICLHRFKHGEAAKKICLLVKDLPPDPHHRLVRIHRTKSQ